jgi:hypothetical protein
MDPLNFQVDSSAIAEKTNFVFGFSTLHAQLRLSHLHVSNYGYKIPRLQAIFLEL